MGFLSKIVSSGIGALVGEVGGVIDSLHTSGEEKAAARAELLRIAQARESELEETLRNEIDGKTKIMMAEMQQDDNYTKRARPTVVYVGLASIVINYVIVPNVSAIFGLQLSAMDLPTEFWAAWGGIVATWVIGRSAEKRGVESKVVSAITGSSL